MRPATGWMANFTSTPRASSSSISSFKRMLGLSHRHAVAGDDDDLGVLHPVDRVLHRGRLDALLGRLGPALLPTAAPEPKPPKTTLMIERFIALHMM
jgi:hypothetical protein